MPLAKELLNAGSMVTYLEHPISGMRNSLFSIYKPDLDISHSINSVSQSILLIQLRFAC